VEIVGVIAEGIGEVTETAETEVEIVTGVTETVCSSFLCSRGFLIPTSIFSFFKMNQIREAMVRLNYLLMLCFSIVTNSIQAEEDQEDQEDQEVNDGKNIETARETRVTENQGNGVIAIAKETEAKRDSIEESGLTKRVNRISFFSISFSFLHIDRTTITNLGDQMISHFSLEGIISKQSVYEGGIALLVFLLGFWMG